MTTKLSSLIVISLLLIDTARSADWHCLHNARREDPVKIGDINAMMVMTYVRGDPGYRKNLECGYLLSVINYDQPRQMYIDVPVVDFDNNIDPFCNKTDVFSFWHKYNETAWRRESWCSESSVSRSFRFLPFRQQIINLWDPSYYLTAQFRSDNEQVRSDAKGLQLDAWALDPKFCHLKMMDLDNYCYLVTPENVSPAQSNQVGKLYLGNFFTVRNASSGRDILDFLRRFSERNKARKDEYPYESPLDLTNLRLWTGYFVNESSFSEEDPVMFYSDPIDDCIVKQVKVTREILTGCNKNPAPVALNWLSNGSVHFSCVPGNDSMPALIQFSQIPKTKGDLHPQLFRTCDIVLPTTTTTPPPTTVVPPADNTIIIIVIAVALVIIMAIVIGVVVYFCRRRGQQPQSTNGDEPPRQGNQKEKESQKPLMRMEPRDFKGDGNAVA